MRNRLHFSSRVAVSQTQEDRRKCGGPLPDEFELPGAQRILMPFSDTCPQLRDANSAADLATVAAFTCAEQTWRTLVARRAGIRGSVSGTDLQTARLLHACGICIAITVASAKCATQPIGQAGETTTANRANASASIRHSAGVGPAGAHARRRQDRNAHRGTGGAGRLEPNDTRGDRRTDSKQPSQHAASIRFSRHRLRYSIESSFIHFTYPHNAVNHYGQIDLPHRTGRILSAASMSSWNSIDDHAYPRFREFGRGSVNCPHANR